MYIGITAGKNGRSHLATSPDEFVKSIGDSACRGYELVELTPYEEGQMEYLDRPLCTWCKLTVLRLIQHRITMLEETIGLSIEDVLEALADGTLELVRHVQSVDEHQLLMFPGVDGAAAGGA